MRAGLDQLLGPAIRDPLRVRSTGLTLALSVSLTENDRTKRVSRFERNTSSAGIKHGDVKRIAVIWIYLQVRNNEALGRQRSPRTYEAQHLRTSRYMFHCFKNNAFVRLEDEVFVHFVNGRTAPLYVTPFIERSRLIPPAPVYSRTLNSPSGFFSRISTLCVAHSDVLMNVKSRVLPSGQYNIRTPNQPICRAGAFRKESPARSRCGCRRRFRPMTVRGCGGSAKRDQRRLATH